MAFHQPARQAAPRNPRPTTLGDGESCVPQLAATRPVDESPTWVLFSPATDTGRSRLSDLGSLNTLAPSEISPGQQASNGFIDAAEEDDDAELDSLDSHLPEFRSAPDTFISSDHVPHSTPVLPAHDGLGSFRLEQEGMGLDVQNRLYAFERYNPRRIKRRRESLEAVRAELEGEENQQIDKMLRIESWRLEQSRYLLEEIQKETRRRRSSTNSMSRTHRANQQAAEDAATLETIDMDTSEEWHDQNHDPSDDRDSIWGRIARKVMQDIMGIESGILSILFGEGLPNEEQLSSTINASGLSSSRRDDSHFPHVLPDSSWEVKMMGRVAKELGLLVHQLSDHPGGFSTFSRIQQMSIPYAGLPAIPESASALISDAVADEKPPSLPEFRPTIPTLLRPTDGTETQHQPSSGHSNPQQQTDNGVTFTQEEWEQDLDIRLVFRYLRSRFLPFSKGSGGLSSTPHIATSTTSTQDAAAKAARVRQHHPLVSRSRNTERRKSKSTTVSNSGLFKPVSSCASQSTRRSVKRSSTSSRHYWDIGGSVGTGSIIATVGPMGSWGEI